MDNFEDLFLSEDEKRKIRAAEKAKKEAAARKNTFESDIPLDDIPPLEGEDVSNSGLDDALSKLKEQFNIDDSVFESFKEKKEKFVSNVKENFKDLDKKAETFNQKADDSANQAMDFLFESGKKAADTAKDLFEKGKGYAHDLEEKMRKRDEIEEAKLKNPKHKVEDSLLGGFDSFFNKAKDLADKLDKKVEDRYSSSDEIKITQQDSPKKKEDKPSRIYGFEDLDGDGNPLIDDAIIEE